MSIKIIPNNGPTDIEQGSILRALRQFNRAHTSPDPQGSFAVTLESDERAVVGGLWADYGYDWMYIKYLVLPESARGKGTGTTMMKQAEDRARALGLFGIWVDTFSFQAPGFYEKLGFSKFGEIENHPRGEVSILLQKIL